MPSLPKAFAERIIAQYPNGQEILDGLKTDPVHAVLFNQRKSKIDIANPVPWCAKGEIVANPASAQFDPLLHAGVYQSVGASEMFLDHVLKHVLNHDDPVCIDMCAAPGGTSLILQSHLDGRGLLVSNEVISKRNFTLQENLAKWGYSNKIVIQSKADSVGRLGPIFDCMVIDAPSSGEARFRASHHTRTHWSESMVEENVKSQKEIVDNAKWGLKTGGILIYSTNTFAQVENEEVVKRLCSRGEFEPVEIPVDAAWDIEQPMPGCYQFFPHKAQGEGFFITVLKRVKEVRPFGVKSVQIPILKAPKEIKLDDGLVVIRDRKLHAFPEKFIPYLHHISRVKLHSVGTSLGEQKGRDFIADHEVALALQVKHDFPLVNVDRSQALSYLKKETFPIEGPEGLIAVAFEGHALGWAKNLGSRINNHFPKYWRIQ